MASDSTAPSNSPSPGCSSPTLAMTPAPDFPLPYRYPNPDECRMPSSESRVDLAARRARPVIPARDRQRRRVARPDNGESLDVDQEVRADFRQRLGGSCESAGTRGPLTEMAGTGQSMGDAMDVAVKPASGYVIALLSGVLSVHTV